MGNKKDKFVMTLDDLPTSAKMETMLLALGGATVRLPAAATFASLVDLSLENLELADASSGHLLNRLLSPACCPRLRKLSVRNVGFAWELDELLLEAEALMELTCEIIRVQPYALILRTPSLRVLRMVNCYLDGHELTLSAPKLEELLFFGGMPVSDFDIDGELSCVRSLKVELISCAPGGDGALNRLAIRLLNFCTSATCLDIDLYINAEAYSLKTNFLCNHPDHWRPPHEIYLPHLKEAKFTGLVGTECELRFIKSMLTSTTQLQKVTIRFDREYNLSMNRVNAFERIQMVEGGTWTCDEAYSSLEWKSCL
ncbi:unnamed protein product [Urochloa humidicola]